MSLKLMSTYLEWSISNASLGVRAFLISLEARLSTGCVRPLCCRRRWGGRRRLLRRRPAERRKAALGSPWRAPDAPGGLCGNQTEAWWCGGSCRGAPNQRGGHAADVRLPTEQGNASAWASCAKGKAAAAAAHTIHPPCKSLSTPWLCIIFLLEENNYCSP